MTTEINVAPMASELIYLRGLKESNSNTIKAQLSMIQNRDYVIREKNSLAAEITGHARAMSRCLSEGEDQMAKRHADRINYLLNMHKNVGIINQKGGASR